MAPKKRTRTTQRARTSSQASQHATGTATTTRTQGNAPHPLSLTNPEHVACFALLE